MAEPARAQIRQQEVQRREGVSAATGTAADGTQVSSLGKVNLAQLGERFREQAAEIGGAQTAALTQAAKRWIPLLHTNREIILQNELLTGKDRANRITNEQRSSWLIETGAVQTRGGSQTKTTGAMSRPNAMTRWSFLAELGTEDEKKALKKGVKYGEKLYYTPIEMLEDTDESFTRVYDFFAEKISARRQRAQRDKIPTDIEQAVQKALNRFAVQTKVPKSAEHPKGYASVKLATFPEVAFHSIVALMKKHAGAWTEEQRAMLHEHVDLPVPETPEPDEDADDVEEEE